MSGLLLPTARDCLNLAGMLGSFKHMFLFSQWKKWLKKPDVALWLVSFLILSLVTAGFVGRNPTASPAGKYLLHSWRSLKKIVNVFYLPLWFRESDLPVYRLVVDPDDLKTLNDRLPIDYRNLSYGLLTEEEKNYVSAYFESPRDRYTAKIKVRYRGLVDNNWQAEQKSLRLKFPADQLFNGGRALNLIIPTDRQFFLEPLNVYRAKKLGLLASEFNFVRVYLNNRDFGVYLSVWPWSKEWLAQNGLVDTDNIFSQKDETADLNNARPAFFNWKSYTAAEEEGFFEELAVLSQLTNEASDEEFFAKIGSLVDLEKIYRWQLINLLAGSAHQSDQSNFVLLFKKETGQFEPLPWNVESYFLKDKIYDGNLPLLVRRIFKSEQFSSQFLRFAAAYLNDDQNLQDDLAYYGHLYQRYRPDFYRDQAKNVTNFTFDWQVAEGRRLMADNFYQARRLVASENVKTAPGPWPVTQTEEKKFGGSFNYFNDIFRGAENFIQQHPQFRWRGGNSLVLGPGAYLFSRTVIVPRDWQLTIEPGTTLFFSPGVSLISYSPVRALGRAEAPIVLKPAFPAREPWGSFGVINSGLKENHFQYWQVSGGSTALINGVEFTSQFSLHNAKTVIADSVFANGKSDDGLHVILGSVEIKNSRFENNAADGLDLDFVQEAKIIGNRFYNLVFNQNGGDGLDLSGAVKAEIFDNQIINFGDKGISIGERAQAVLRRNIVGGSNIGVAIKDNSVIEMDGDIIVGNRQAGLALYRKKQEFVSGGRAQATRLVLWNNHQEIEKDFLSQLALAFSIVQGGYADGFQISQLAPDWQKILSPDLTARLTF